MEPFEVTTASSSTWADCGCGYGFSTQRATTMLEQCNLLVELGVPCHQYRVLILAIRLTAAVVRFRNRRS